jgi:RNA polymerase-binding transcription factor DksA
MIDSFIFFAVIFLATLLQIDAETQGNWKNMRKKRKTHTKHIQHAHKRISLTYLTSTSYANIMTGRGICMSTEAQISKKRLK